MKYIYGTMIFTGLILAGANAESLVNQTIVSVSGVSLMAIGCYLARGMGE